MIIPLLLFYEIVLAWKMQLTFTNLSYLVGKYYMAKGAGGIVGGGNYVIKYIYGLKCNETNKSAIEGIVYT